MPTKWPSPRWADVGRGCAGGLGRHVRRTRRERGVLAELLEPQPAVDPLRELLEDDRGVGRELGVEAGCELREPRELVGHGRDHRAPEPLQAPLEVHRGSLALERGGRGEDEVGPADRERVEHRDRDHGVGLLRERPDVRRSGGLVAGHDEQGDRLGIRLVAVRGGGPCLRDAARVRGRGKVERRAPGLAVEAELVGRLGQPCAAAPARTRPDEHGALRRAEPLAELVCRVDELPQRVGRAADRRRHRSARADRHDLGACAARLPQPEVDHGRAIDDVVVAHDDDELGTSDRRERRPGRRRARLRSTRRARRSARRGRAAAARRGRMRSRSSPSRRAPSRSFPARRGAAPRRGRARRPTRRARARAHRAAAARARGPRPGGAGR